MHDDLEVAYSPKRGMLLGVIAFFSLTTVFLGYFALTEPWTPATKGMLAFASVAAVLGLVCAIAFAAILLRSKNWRVRLDSHGVSIDTLFGRRSVAWNEFRSVQVTGEGRTRGMMVVGANSSLAINAMLMSDPSQFDRLHREVQRRGLATVA